MFKRFISITLLALLTGVTAAPLFSFHDCDRPCCAEGQDTCCTMEVMETCTMSMDECNKQVFIPVLSAPIAQYESSIDIADGDIVILQLLSRDFTYSFLTVNEIIHPPEPPPSFNLPLLV